MALLPFLLALAAAGPQTAFRLERYDPGPKPPPFDTALFDPLPAFMQVRSAGCAGWADSGLYIGTRFGRYPQIHRVAAPGAARVQSTFFPRRIATFHMNPDPARRNFLYTFDAGGDERFQLRLFDLRSGSSRGLGMPPGRADGVIWNDSGTAFAYAHVPAGTDRWDIRLGRPDGFDTLLLSLPGAWSAMDLRPDGKRLLVQRYVSAAEAELYALDIPGGDLTLLTPGSRRAYADDAAWIRRDNTQDTSWDVVFTSDRDGEAHRLYRLDPEGILPGSASGTGNPLRRVSAAPVALSASGPWDVEWVSAAPDRRTLAWSANEDGYSRLFVLPPGARAPKALSGGPRGLIGEALFRPGAGPREFAVTASNGTMPGDVWVCDWTADRWTRWTFSEPGGLPEGSFRAPRLFRYPGYGPGSQAARARPGTETLRSEGDGAGKRSERRDASDRSSETPDPGGPRAAPGHRPEVPAWLYRPDSVRFPGPRPVVIRIHGGPEMQARPGFDAFVQYLTGTLGYAVILPNVRGSSGYGRSWLEADDGYRRLDAVGDIGALLDWIGTQPYLDPERTAVSGRSYGGFMSLASLAEYGSRLKAGISAVGISHFPTFLKKTSGYRRDLRRAEYGDERDPRMAAFLDSISPLTRVSRFRTPLLLVHGRNDPRVPYEESARIFAALKARKIPVWFLTFDEEGHAARAEEAVLAEWRAETEFLVRRLDAPASAGPR